MNNLLGTCRECGSENIRRCAFSDVYGYECLDCGYFPLWQAEPEEFDSYDIDEE